MQQCADDCMAITLMLGAGGGCQVELYHVCIQKGQTEVWISSLPGFPDGISRSEDGNYWVAMAGPNQPFVKVLPYRCGSQALAFLLDAANHRLTAATPASSSCHVCMRLCVHVC